MNSVRQSGTLMLRSPFAPGQRRFLPTDYREARISSTLFALTRTVSVQMRRPRRRDGAYWMVESAHESG